MLTRVPLKASFAIASMIGILFSLFYLYHYSPKWAMAFFVVFFCMFIATFVSMSKATPEFQLR